jgi:hypothetical protein
MRSGLQSMERTGLIVVKAVKKTKAKTKMPNDDMTNRLS